MYASPKVSIVLPTFNENPGVIDSCVESLLSQVFQDWECLVIDESYAEESIRAWDRWRDEEQRIRIVRPTQRLGLAGSLNEGLRQARGSLVARVDTDDPSEPERLQQQVTFLDAHPRVDIVGTAMTVLNETGDMLGKRFYPEEHEQIMRKMLWSTGIAHPTVMARRSAFERLGYYNSSFRNAEDLELWLRWIKAGARFANLPDLLVRCTIQSEGRPRRHWRYNLKARASNLNHRRCLLQLAGIGCAALAWSLPPRAFFKVQQLLNFRS